MSGVHIVSTTVNVAVTYLTVKHIKIVQFFKAPYEYGKALSRLSCGE